MKDSVRSYLLYVKRKSEMSFSPAVLSKLQSALALLQVSEREGFVTQLALVHPILRLLDIHLSLKYAEE